MSTEPEAWASSCSAPGGITWPSTAVVLDRLVELKAEILIITDEGNTEACAKPARLIQLPLPHPFCEGSRDLYTPIPYIVPAQLFAAQLAVIKGVNPDRPADHREDHADDVNWQPGNAGWRWQIAGSATMNRAHCSHLWKLPRKQSD